MPGEDEYDESHELDERDGGGGYDHDEYDLDQEYPQEGEVGRRSATGIPCAMELQRKYPSLNSNTIFVGLVVGSLVVLVSLLTILALASSPASAGGADEGALAAYRLLAKDWDAEFLSDPITATMIGVSGPINGQLPNRSWAAIQSAAARRAAFWSRAQALQVDELPPNGDVRVNGKILVEEIRLSVERDRFLELDNLMPVSPMTGPQVDLPNLVGMTVLETAEDCQHYQQRLEKVAGYVEQTVELMRMGVARGITQPCDFIHSVPEQIDGQLPQDPADSDFYQPLLASRPFITEEIRASARSVIASAITPAFQGFRDYFVDHYLFQCHSATSPIGLGALANGSAFYTALVREFTTDPQAEPSALHQLGLDQVALVKSQMEAAFARTGFNGSIAEFMDFLRTDAQYQFADTAAALEHARAFGKQVDAMLPSFFSVLPRCPYAIVAVPDAVAESSPGGYYDSPDAECTRPGVFHLNTYGTKVTSFLLPSLFLHEAVPGHHLQIALTNELEAQPEFRKYGDWTAFIEGWAHFAEYFGEPMGFYTDPVVDIGRLSDAMLRACRLVIDTGLHWGVMTKAQAVELLVLNSALALSDITAEVDRYGSWPGQAVAYRVGMLKFQALHQRGEEELGERYSARHFNSEMLSHGSLPMNILEDIMDDYINDQLQTPSVEDD